LAAYRTGNVGRIVFSPYNQSVDPKQPGDFANVNHWELHAVRAMKKITPFLATQDTFAPSTVGNILIVRGLVDIAGRVPADFHHLPVLFEVGPDTASTGDQWWFDGYVEAYKLITAIGGMNSFELTVRGSVFLQELEQIGW